MIDMDSLIKEGYHMAHTQEERQAILDKLRDKRVRFWHEGEEYVISGDCIGRVADGTLTSLTAESIINTSGRRCPAE